jgi:hypothetical protein
VPPHTIWGLIYPDTGGYSYKTKIAVPPATRAAQQSWFGLQLCLTT